jgi:hypothetical protein
LTASVENWLMRPAPTLTRRAVSDWRPNEMPWVSAESWNVGVWPPTVKPALAGMAKFASSVAPNVALPPMAPLLLPVTVVLVPMAMVLA